MEATWGVLEKDKVQALAAEKQGVGGGTDLRERQGQKHNKSQEYSSRTGTPDLSLYKSKSKRCQGSLWVVTVLLFQKPKLICKV